MEPFARTVPRASAFSGALVVTAHVTGRYNLRTYAAIAPGRDCPYDTVQWRYYSPGGSVLWRERGGYCHCYLHLWHHFRAPTPCHSEDLFCNGTRPRYFRPFLSCTPISYAEQRMGRRFQAGTEFLGCSPAALSQNSHYLRHHLAWTLPLYALAGFSVFIFRPECPMRSAPTAPAVSGIASSRHIPHSSLQPFVVNTLDTVLEQ